jgi:IS5 family transposase
MLERHIAFYGEAPRQAAADGGFASRHNLSQAEALGVSDLAFHKKAGLRIKEGRRASAFADAVFRVLRKRPGYSLFARRTTRRDRRRDYREREALDRFCRILAH